jgi:hypothetical protein
MRRYDFQLVESAVSRFLIYAPAPELRRVPKTIPLHVIVRDFNH